MRRLNRQIFHVWNLFIISYQTADGTTVEEISDARKSAFARDGEEAATIIAKIGRFTFTSPEGITFQTYWTADENGFAAYGDHLASEVPTDLVQKMDEFRASTRAFSDKAFLSQQASQ